MGILGSFARGRQDTLPPTNDIFLPTVTHVVAIWNGSFTSIPAVRGANNWGVIQFDEEGRVIPTWEDDDDGDAA
jgi:hypothetical protein